MFKDSRPQKRRVERAVLGACGVQARRHGPSDLSPTLSLTSSDSIQLSVTYRDVARALAQEEVAENTRNPDVNEEN
jgi:hypothetical protein